MIRNETASPLRLSQKRLAEAAAEIRRTEIMRAARVMLREIKEPRIMTPFELRLDGWLARAEILIGEWIDGKFMRKAGVARE
jgi:hypothetical protein